MFYGRDKIEVYAYGLLIPCFSIMLSNLRLYYKTGSDFLETSYTTL